MNDVAELEQWMDLVGGTDWIWSAKFLSANDTYAKANVHQGGPYVAKDLLAIAFPELSRRAEHDENPDVNLPAQIDSHGTEHDLRLVWYNSRRARAQANGRDEARLTRWGGRDAPIMVAESTGALVVFAFRIPSKGRNADALRIWLCRTPEEEDAVLSRVGDVEPGRGQLVDPQGLPGVLPTGGCALEPDELPDGWLQDFPMGDEIVRWVCERRPRRALPNPDERLVVRRDCEYDVFRSIERAHVFPRLQAGLSSVEAFIALAGEVLNRRKSRSGRSLELQLRSIFEEEGISYSWSRYTEDKRKPDFIFPSIEHYRDRSRSDDSLRMLAVKTTCKDRWRQILTEAARIPRKHLFTLQEGVSEDQFREMEQEGVTLVVPKQLIRAYPASVQPKLLSLSGFLEEVA